jgi:aryl-alcohol dehydrogenase-like predicted oxidoreductase
MSLSYYNTLGRSGLKVSPLCLGTMTFGEDWGWGSSEDTARQIFQAYIKAGGNFIDTADGYTNGSSETLVGKFIQAEKLRDSVVLATKYTFCGQPGNPNAGGNGVKNMHRALNGSLKRLNTDYIDLYWMHAWDRVTPAEEVLQAMNDLIRAGKILYFGLSDVPSWYAAKMHTLAQAHGLHAPVAMQLEYSLVERSIEYEFVDMVNECGMGICPWSPLGSGLLSGKYKKEDLGKDGRLATIQNSLNDSNAKLFTDRNWKIVDMLNEVSKVEGKKPAQVALNWVATQPGITSTIIGATKLPQLEDNLASLDFSLSKESLAKLNDVSVPTAIHPYVFFGEQMQSMINGGAQIRGWNMQKQ